MALNEGIYEYTGAEEIDNGIPAKRWSKLLNLLGSSVRAELRTIRGTLGGVVDASDAALAAAVNKVTSATRIAINGAINAQIIGSAGIDNAIATLIGNAASAARGALNTAIDARFAIASSIDVQLAALVGTAGSAIRAAIIAVDTSKPIFQVGRGAAQALPAGVWTLVNAAYAAPALNTGFTGWAGGVLTISRAGWYRVGAQNRFPAASTVSLQVTVNSTAQDSAATILTSYASGSVSAGGSVLVYLAPADALRLYAYTLGAQSLTDFARGLNLSVEYVRA